MSVCDNCIHEEVCHYERMLKSFENFVKTAANNVPESLELCVKCQYYVQESCKLGEEKRLNS